MKKRNRSRALKQAGGVGNYGSKQGGGGNNSEDLRVLKGLQEAFASVSMEEAAAAYKEANGDVNKAAEILDNLVESAEDRSTTCSSSSGHVGSCTGSIVHEGFVVAKNGTRQKGRAKKVVAAAGTVSTMLGKDYVRSTPMKRSMKAKGFIEESFNKEDAEQFLSSILGEDCELSLAVVRDVLCQCGYDVEKALNILLELSAASGEQNEISERNGNIRDSLFESSDSLTDRTSDSTSHSSESELYESVWYAGPPPRSYSKVCAGSETYSSTKSEDFESEIPQKVLQSLFNLPTPKNAEHEPNSMNWRNVVKKIASFGQKLESHPINSEIEHPTQAKGDHYEVSRQTAKQHWGSMRLYYQKAATAFSNGEREYASHLAEQGRLQNQRALEADEKASQDIFIARNKGIENMITIDLHGQHVKQAMRLLKLHLLFGAYVRSVRLFRVITGCGRHGVGKSKLKHTVIGLLDKEGIEWKEENSGTLLVKVEGQTDFSFLNTDSDDE